METLQFPLTSDMIEVTCGARVCPELVRFIQGKPLASTPFTLKSGRILPSVGLGLWKIPESETAEIVYQAALAGYRHFDCACDYGNEKQVGEGLRRILDDGICGREDLWITSKLWNTFHRPEHVILGAKKTLSDLQLDQLDLYLIHFPIALKFVPIETRYPPGWIYDPSEEHPRMEPDQLPLIETWQAMEELVDAGLVKEIGVSNFGVSLIRELINSARIPPAVLQVELHPFLTQEKLLRFCREAGIVVTAFSPLGAISYVPLGMATPEESLLEHPVINRIAAKHKRTPAQVLLRWGVQRGTSVIVKTTKMARLLENLDLFDFKLSSAEMDEIRSLNISRRYNDPGEFCESAFGTFFPIYE